MLKNETFKKVSFNFFSIFCLGDRKMTTFLTVLLFVLGLLFIVKGGDLFVDAAGWFAEISGIPKFIIGATVVSLATTMPELLVSVFAAREGRIDISVGNAVGSVTANLGLIMGISLVCIPSSVRLRETAPKAVMMLIASTVMVVSGLFCGGVGIVTSITLLILLAVFVYENIVSAKRTGTQTIVELTDGKKADKRAVLRHVAMFVIGAAGIIYGADLLVDKGSMLAALFGVPERIIGVTMIAVGTSLPELATTLTAISKRQSSLSIGNIIGANIIDLTLILPISAFVSGSRLPISATSAYIDIPVCLLIACTAVIPTLISKKFTRPQGIAMLVLYAAYVVVTCSV